MEENRQRGKYATIQNILAVCLTMLRTVTTVSTKVKSDFNNNSDTTFFVSAKTKGQFLPQVPTVSLAVAINDI